MSIGGIKRAYIHGKHRRRTNWSIIGSAQFNCNVNLIANIKPVGVIAEYAIYYQMRITGCGLEDRVADRRIACIQ